MGWTLDDCEKRRGGSLPRSLGFVLEVRSGRMDERSGRLRRVVQNMLLLLPLLLGSSVSEHARSYSMFG